ncbi:MAG TPA: hypothetical protein VH253_03995 [Phycisphaerae bacterium]|nr:hypothetical protein [Phycisphaerae bacterium]
MRIAVGLISALLGLAVSAALAQAASGGGAQTPGGSTAEAPSAPGASVYSRVVATFDFEERALGNFESVPMYWSKLVGRGYPAYATGRFDTTVARSATTSFRLDIDGGSVAYRFTPPPATFGKGPGRIAVTPDGDYVILAFVKTTPLAHARADLTAWFADANGKPLPDTEVHAIPWAANGTQDAGAWHVMHVFVHGPEATHGGGKSLVLQLGLLQPQQLAEAGLNTGGKKSDGLPAQFQLYQQDIRGTAWFDDITVFQLPRLSISVPAAATIAPQAATPAGAMDVAAPGSVNVLPPGGQVALDLAVSDISRDSPDGSSAAKKQLGVTLTITDPQGLVFAREHWNAAPTPEHPWTQAYRHPPLPGGLYTATLDILEGGAPGGGANATGLIARRQTRFVTLADQQPPRPPAPEFGLSAAHWPAARWSALEPLARESGAGLVEAPAWRDDLPEGAGGSHDAAPFDLLVSALSRDHIGVLASLESLPAAVAARLRSGAAAATQPDSLAGSSSLLSLASADPALWRPSISFLLARHANSVSFWQVMEHPDPAAAALDPARSLAPASPGSPAFAALYARARTEIGPLLNDPRLLIPWNALYDFDPKSYPGAILNLRLPATIKPDQLPACIASFKAASAPGARSAASPDAAPAPAAAGPILLHIDPLPDDGTYSSDDRLADFAKRIVFARSANPTCILIDVPFAEHRATTALGDIDAPAAEPDELLPAYRTLIHALAGARAPIGPGDAGGGGVRELPVAQGIRAFLCERPGPQQSSLILWNESADTPTVSMDLPLGDLPREVELTGESHPAKRTGPGADALTRLTVGAMPLILENIDPHLLELRSSFALAAKVFPAGAGSMQTEVTLTNPGPDALRGLLHLEVPKGWTVEPSELHVSLLAGASLHEKLTIRYPFTETEGVKFFRGRLVHENGGELALACPVAVRSKLVAVDGFCQLQPNGDLVVQQMVTNTAATPLNAQAYALVPGYPRQQRFITDLQPGQTLIKRYVFAASAFTGEDSAAENRPKPGENQPDARAIADALKGKNATLGVRQTDGKTLLAKTIPLE